MRTDGPVVVALDGSTSSEDTMRWGVDEAAARGADVVLVRCVDDSWAQTAWTWYPEVSAFPPDVEAKEYLSDVLFHEQERHPQLEFDVRIPHGPVVPSLRDLSDDAQLLVVGSGARRGRRRTGAVAPHVAAHAHCPVAVVRSDPDHPELPAAPVVVGIDGSPGALAAAHAAAHEAWTLGRGLVVVHARPTVPDPFGRGTGVPVRTDDPDHPTHRAARAIADELAATYEGLHVDVELVDDDPATALVELSHASPLLVVGSRGLGGFRGMLLGSVSADVVREATCPVLVVHEG
ncbi:universal stress protein [Cellulomonas chitinilytica]|uniref:Universal stress protein n=1 Tax=Cellulomonas chitinilytica TaxID=398759 RepID=A0A919P150_9CELL|nr:universal stress protein [Cellulomonas chitinilytica]GIG21342.1 universal stress protein [Cellulomonas chitinilytica]